MSFPEHPNTPGGPNGNGVHGRARILTLPLVLAAALSLLAAGREFTSFDSVKPILNAQRAQAPAELKGADAPQWLAWARRRDQAIRARLEQGDLDSMVNLLLSGTSFTQRPRIPMEGLTEASKSGVLKARVDDLVAGLRSPGDNERLLFLRRLLHSQGIDPEAAEGPRQSGVFILKNLLRVAEERKTLAARAAEVDRREPPDDPASLLDRSSFFQDRGLSLDTGIIPNFSIEQTMRDLKARGVLREGQVARVAVIGPGLDFIDKNEASAYDYYPQQTLQPFALSDCIAEGSRGSSQRSRKSASSMNCCSPRLRTPARPAGSISLTRIR